MNLNFQEQMDKINRFNENESRKMQEIKKLLSSKFSFITLITSIVVVVFYYILCVINQIIYLENITFVGVISSLGENLLNCVFPAIFIFYYLGLYKRSRSDKPVIGRDGELSKLFSLRSYTKFFFIINIIGYVSNAFLYLNIENLVTQYPEMFLGITDFELQASANLGIYFVVMTALYTLTWFSLSRGSKKTLQSLIFDSTDYNYVDMYICIVLLLITPIIETIGTTLALFGINNPLTTIYFTEPILFTDIMYLIYNLLCIALMILISLLFIELKKILNNVSGSTNPLNDGEIVYTVNLEDDKE